MHSLRSAPCRRPLIVHAKTRTTATPSGPCTGARRRGLPTGHRLRSFRRGTVRFWRSRRRKLSVAPGESARSRKIPPFGPSPAVARVVSLRSTPRATAALPLRTARMRYRRLEIGTSGTVRGGGGNILTYSARDFCRVDNVGGRRTLDPIRSWPARPVAPKQFAIATLRARLISWSSPW